jgi:hypothetical protein
MLSEPPPTTVPEWTYHARFAPERQSAARARSFVSSHLIEQRLLRLVDPVRAVASELAANVIVHARTPFVVTLSRTGATVLLTVQDASSRRPTRRSVQVMAEGGHGLNLVVALSSNWGVTEDSHGTKSVWVTFDIRSGQDQTWM